ncbi:MAG: hypothetical protein IJA69_04165 [Clostridia bacterium]|nr:hypothetical protein [Clostridia bacterium]
MQIPILNDSLFISNLVKQIDKDYYIIYDTKKQKYQLHNSAQVGGSYCLTCPYKELDARFLEYAQKTRRENQETIFKEIEKQNELLKKENNI